MAEIIKKQRTFSRPHTAAKRLGVGLSTLYAMAARGACPRPIRLKGTRISVFDDLQLDEYMEEQVKAAQRQ